MRTWTPAPLDPDARGDEHVLKLVLESICCGTVSRGDLADLWRRHEAKVLKHARGVDRWSWQSGGSWNHGIVALVAWYLYAKASIGAAGNLVTNEPYGILLRYCQRQLQGPPDGHCLGGREMLSRRYLKIVLGALEWAWMTASRDGDGNLAGWIDRVLEAHALTLSLFTVATPLGYITANPGARSKRGTSHEALSSWIKGLRHGKKWPTSGEGRQWAIGDRLCAASTWNLSDEADFAVGAVAVDGKPFAAEVVVERLNELGVRMVVPITVYRTEEGVGSWLHANPHGVTAPLLAASCVNGRHYAAHVHPDPEDSGHGRFLGVCRGGRIGTALFADAAEVIPEYAEPAPGAVRLTHGNYYATIPAPPGDVIYEITIDRDGVHLAGSTPSPRPEPRPTPEEPAMTENEIMARILHAIATDHEGNQAPLSDFTDLTSGRIGGLDVRLHWPPRDPERYRSFVEHLREMPW